MEAIDYMPHLKNRGTTAREKLKNAQLAAANEAFETGVDPEFLSTWTWPHYLLEASVKKMGHLNLTN